MSGPKVVLPSMALWLWLALTVIPVPKAVMANVEAWIEAEMRRLDPSAYPQANLQADSQATMPQTSRQPRWAPGGSGA